MPKTISRNPCSYPGCVCDSRFHDRISGNKYCRKHRNNTCFNFRDSKCIVLGCSGWQQYNYLGGRALFCKAHSISGMFNAYKAFKGYPCFILGCDKLCRSALPVCKSHTPKLKNIRRFQIKQEDLQKFYMEQQIEATERMKYILNGRDVKIDSHFVISGELIMVRDCPTTEQKCDIKLDGSIYFI